MLTDQDHNTILLVSDSIFVPFQQDLNLIQEIVYTVDSKHWSGKPRCFNLWL